MSDRWFVEQRGKRGLRAKLVRVYALQVALISVAALFGLLMTYLIVQNVLTREALTTETEYFWDKRSTNLDHPLPEVRNLRGYLALDGDLSAVPAALHALELGFGKATGLPGSPLVFVSEQGTDRLYLVFAEAQVLDLVLFFGLAPLAAVLLTVYLLLFLTYRLSHAAISPMLNLAQAVEDYDFRSTERLQVPVATDDMDRETRLMLETLEGFSARLEQFIERERTFTRDAGHELRTPMAVLKGSLDIFEDSGAQFNPGQIKTLARMRRAVTEMETLLETLLLLAREEEVFTTDEGADSLTSVNQVVAEEIELLTDLAERNHNRLVLQEDNEALCRAKPRVLGIIVSNLLRNALTYTEHGTVNVRIERDKLIVRDTGVGMDQSDQDKVFTAFYRGENAKHAASGQGLGLALVRRLSQQLGWPVKVRSTLGEGTEFTVMF